MKLKNIKVGDTLEVKKSILDVGINYTLEANDLCRVVEVESLAYEGDLTVSIQARGDTHWVSHKHLRKPKQLTGSDLTRKMLADGETSILCYLSDDNDDKAVIDRNTREVAGYENDWFRTTASISLWRYAVPVEKVTPLSRWTHSNGNTYTVVLITNEHSENQDRYPTTVVYRDCNYEVWSKPLSDWHRSMTKIED